LGGEKSGEVQKMVARPGARIGKGATKQPCLTVKGKKSVKRQIPR